MLSFDIVKRILFLNYYYQMANISYEYPLIFSMLSIVMLIEYLITWTTKGWNATMKTSQIAKHPIIIPHHAIVDTSFYVHVTHPSICNRKKSTRVRM